MLPGSFLCSLLLVLWGTAHSRRAPSSTSMPSSGSVAPLGGASVERFGNVSPRSAGVAAAAAVGPSISPGNHAGHASGVADCSPSAWEADVGDATAVAAGSFGSAASAAFGSLRRLAHAHRGGATAEGVHPLVCRICEELVPSAEAARHSRICNIAHKYAAPLLYPPLSACPQYLLRACAVRTHASAILQCSP